MAQKVYDLGPVCPIYKGNWSSTATYETLNMVRHGTALWVMIAKTYTVGSTPSDSSTFWKKAAQDGATGATGAAGAKGATGAKGVGFVVKGAWASGTAYVNNTTQIDVVTYSGSSYACKKSHTSSDSILPTNTTYWTLLAQKGATGAKGDTGPAGAKGATGATGPKGDNGSSLAPSWAKMVKRSADTSYTETTDGWLIATVRSHVVTSVGYTQVLTFAVNGESIECPVGQNSLSAEQVYTVTIPVQKGAPYVLRRLGAQYVTVLSLYFVPAA